MKIKKICFVGYGPHVEKTIIPSLKLKKENIKVITSKLLFNKFNTFRNIKSALREIDKDFIVYNATPPNIHYRTSKLILELGFNIIVEKPLCLNIFQLKRLRYLANYKKLFIFENMMYLYSKQFSLLKKIIKTKKEISIIKLHFTIPYFNEKSFRSNSYINFLIYDIACYPFSLVSYLNYKIKKFNIFYSFKNRILNYLNITFQSQNVKFVITVGYFFKYKNFVKIQFKDKSSAQLNHFFYGKKIIKKNIIINSKREKKIVYLNDYNVFKKIFNFNKNKFYVLSNNSFYIIKNYLKTLSRINKIIKR
jgi:predicted dehydrogenase